MSSDSTIVRIYTHNIRVACPAAKLLQNELPWVERRTAIAASILVNAGRGISVVCLQECLISQLRDLISLLGDEWEFAGRGRLDGEKEGEFCPILFRKSALRLLSERTFWLSTTPNIPSRGWDAKYPRIATSARFATTSGLHFTVWCTHLDHQGIHARERSARILAVDVNVSRGPRILAGDFNSGPQDAPAALMRASGLRDAAVVASMKLGHKETFTGFAQDARKERIDYIWCSEETQPVLYAVVDAHYGNAPFSDHRPVVADVRIAPQQ